MIQQTSFLPVLVAAILATIIGALWYSPLLFGKAWLKEIGKSADELKKKNPPARGYILSFIASLVTAYVLWMFMALSSNFDTARDGAYIGFFVWFGFIAPIALANVLWEGRSPKVYAINISYYLVSFMAQGALLASWRY